MQVLFWGQENCDPSSGRRLCTIDLWTFSLALRLDALFALPVVAYYFSFSHSIHFCSFFLAKVIGVVHVRKQFSVQSHSGASNNKRSLRIIDGGEERILLLQERELTAHFTAGETRRLVSVSSLILCLQCNHILGTFYSLPN